MRQFLAFFFFLVSCAFAYGQQVCGTVSTCPSASLPLNGNELLYLIQGGTSKKTSIGNLINTTSTILGYPIVYAPLPTSAGQILTSTGTSLPAAWDTPVTTQALITSVETFGASGSVQHTTGSITASTNTLVLASAIDFANPAAGQTIGVMVFGAGAAGASAAGQPSSLSVTAEGTTGSTTYAYKIASCDGNTGYGAAISAVTITNGNATITAANYNHLAWSNGASATGVCIWRSTSGGAYQWITRVIGTSFNDAFAAADVYTPNLLYPATPPVSGRADMFVSSITSGAGTTTLKLSSNAVSTVAGAYVTHEDTAAIQACLNTLPTSGESGVDCFLPNGSYFVGNLSSSGFGGLIGAEAQSTTLLTYSDADTLDETTTNNFYLQGMQIEAYDPATKAAGWCVKFSGLSQAFVSIHCGGYNGIFANPVNNLVIGKVQFDYMGGSYGIRLLGTGVSPAAQIYYVTSTSASNSNPAIYWIDQDSYYAGVNILASNLSGGGSCFSMQDTVNSGTSAPSYAWFNGGCDHSNGHGILLDAGSEVTLGPNAYVSSSITGSGIVTAGTFKGGLSIDPKAIITGNAVNGIDDTEGTYNSLGGQITANSAEGGSSAELYIAAGLTHQDIVDGTVISNTNDNASTADGYCIDIAAGAGDYIHSFADTSAGCTSGEILNGATGSHNSIVSRSKGGFDFGLSIPGNNVSINYLTGTAFSSSWPLQLAQIYDSSAIDEYLLFGSVLGSTATRVSPTVTGGFASMGFRYDYSGQFLDILAASAGTNETPTSILKISASDGSLNYTSLPTGTPATYACFTSGGKLISSGSPC